MKKYFIKIQNKILLLFICVFFIPFGIFSIYVYNNFSKNLENSVLQNITREIEQNDKLLFFNIWFTEYISQKLCNDRYIQVAFSDYNENNDALAQYIAGILNDVSMVQGIVVFPASKATFHYGYDPGDKGYVDFMVNYGKIKTTDGNLQWVSSVENGIIVAGTILRDTMITADNTKLPRYILLSARNYSPISCGIIKETR